MEFLQQEELSIATLPTDRSVTPLCQRKLDDKAMRAMGSRTQHDYVRHVRAFAAFLRRSPETAAMTLRCSLTCMTDQRAISSSVRPQPMQNPEAFSIAHLFTQGDAGGVSPREMNRSVSFAGTSVAAHKQHLHRQSASGPIGGEKCSTSSHQQRSAVAPVPGPHLNAVPQAEQVFGLNASLHMGQTRLENWTFLLVHD